MKVTFRVNETMTLEQECPTIKTAFKFLAYAQEVFGVRKCPQSGNTDHKLKYRVAKDKDGNPCEYFSLEDRETGWEFKFGQKREEGQPLFPKGWEPPFQKEEKQQTNGRPQQRQEEPQYEMAGAGVDIAF